MGADAMVTLEEAWAQREDVVYPALFGQQSRGIFVLTWEHFSRWNVEPDPRWLHIGVFEFAPTPARPSWLYVTSGASNPWDVDPGESDPQEYSGLGTELVLETRGPADWAVSALLQLLAYNILLAHGNLGEARVLDYGARIPLGGAINGDPSCLLRSVAVTRPSHLPASFALASGLVDLLHVVGITESEVELARATSTAGLVAALQEAGAYPVTDPPRASIA